MNKQYFNKTLWFWLFHLGLPAGLGIWLAFGYPTQWDFKLIAPYYSTQLMVFPLRHDHFLTVFMHAFLKNSVIFITLMMLAILISSFFKVAIKPYRRLSGWLFTGLTLTTTIIWQLKSHNIHACPWSLAMYGGTAPYVDLFGIVPAGLHPGRCFPAGHASAGFALLSFYFALRDTRRKAAYVGLAIALFLGFAMGWSQMARGAHFMSHTLWCLWVVWMVLLVLYITWPPVNRIQAKDL